MFSERDLDNNPYSEISQGDGGKIEVETDNGVLAFTPVKLKTYYQKHFLHRLKYTVFMSNSFKVMRFAKNCGNFKISEAFENPHLVTFTKTVVFKTQQEI